MNRREAAKALFGLSMIPIITKIPADHLKPEDVIVLECTGPISSDTAERLRERLTGLWPQHKIVVLAEGMKLRIVSMS